LDVWAWLLEELNCGLTARIRKLKVEAILQAAAVGEFFRFGR
jgi:hypothetical protein